MPVRTAFIFPGQGCQSVKMLGELDSMYREVRTTFMEASDVVSLDLYRLMHQGPIEELNQTTITQPIVLAASVALWRIWLNSTDHLPAVMAGHSLGEYSALVCSGALSFEEGLRLVARRAELMQNSVTGECSMAAIIGLDKEIVVKLCQRISTKERVVEAANFNTPLQTVIAGERDHVKRVMEAARSEGAHKCVLLSVTVLSHCSLMKEAAIQFAQEIKKVTLKAPQMEIIHNCDARSHNSLEHIRDALVEQLYRPLRWVDTIHHILAGGIEDFVEIGPGRVLASLLKRIDKNLKTYSINSSKSLNYTLEKLTV